MIAKIARRAMATETSSGISTLDRYSCTLKHSAKEVPCCPTPPHKKIVHVNFQELIINDGHVNINWETKIPEKVIEIYI